MYPKFAVTLAVLATVTQCGCASHPYQKPLETDRRSPCPGINTFANHGFIPRDGFNVSFAEIRAGIVEAANFHPSLIDSIIAAGVGGSTTEYDDTIHLDDLAIHGFPGEVDGSMSRNDIFFGDNHSFNATIWDMSFAHFHNPVVSVQDAAQVCVDRFAADDAANPEFDPKSPEGTPPMTVCFGSAGLYMLLMRDADGNPVRDWINTFFRHERLPEGWAKWPTPVTADDLNASLEAVMAAASGLTPSDDGLDTYWPHGSALAQWVYPG